jgi:Histidine phosphatase superfamily (branch 2)
VNHFSRGGTRLPNIGEIERMISLNENLHANVVRNYNLGRTQLCREDFEAIQAWRLNATLTLERNYELHPIGQEELRGMARRYQEAFPQVLPRVYNRNQFEFRHTYRDRTQDSALAFAEGLFGNSNIVLEPVPNVDRLLRVNIC